MGPGKGRPGRKGEWKAPTTPARRAARQAGRDERERVDGGALPAMPSRLRALCALCVMACLMALRAQRAADERARYRRLRSSMLSAIERGREPPVDELNGEVVRRASGLDLPVPVNAAVVEMVKRIGRGEVQPGVPALETLFADTRVALRALRLAA